MGGASDFERRGWAVLPFRLSAAQCDALASFIPDIGAGVRLDPGSLPLPASLSAHMRGLGYLSQPLRAVGFHKGGARNWSLPWHQDRDHATLDARRVSPSLDTLQRSAFLHIALDDSGPGRGGLEIAEGSHHHGRVPARAIPACLDHSVVRTPDAPRGTVLALKALSLHRSGPAAMGRRRRALRLDYAAGPP